MSSTSMVNDTLREKIAHELEVSPGQFTGVLAKRYNVSEAEVLRAHPEHLCTELDGSRIPQIVRALESLGYVTALCSNEGCVLEVNGKYGGFSDEMGFLNVQTDTIDMHLRANNIKSAFAFIKTPHVGGAHTHSVQFYAENGTACFKVFVLDYVAKKFEEDHAKQVAAWEALRDEYKAPAAV